MKKEKKRQEIIEFIMKCPGIPFKWQIEEELKLDIRNYFKQPYLELIKKIKINNDNVLVCKDPQQELLCNQLVSE